MKPLDRYRLKEKMKAIGIFSWDLLVNLSSVVIKIFVLITCIVFWTNMSVYANDITKLAIIKMFLIVMVCFIIVEIEGIRRSWKI